MNGIYGAILTHNLIFMIGLAGIVSSGVNIITSGLVFWIDAAQLRSYSGSGTTWTDLTANANDVILTNGATFSPSDGGAIVFDGVDDYGDFPTVTNLNNSLSSNEVWIKLDLPLDGNAVQVLERTNLSRNTFNIGKNNNNFWFGTLRDSTDTIRNVIYSTATATSNWTHVVTTYNGTQFSIYTNGTIRNTATFTSTINTTGTPTFRLMQATSGIAPTRGSLAIARIYNRAITATEVLQNYNAEKSRFGL